MSFLDAVKAGDIAAVREQLASNPAVASMHEGGSSAVCLAVFYGNTEVAHAIVDSGHELNLFEAAALGDVSRMQELLSRGPLSANEFGDDGFHPLGLACAFGHAGAARILLERGADMALETRNLNVRVAPIHSAAFGKNIEVMRLLLEFGADPNLRAEGGFVALHTAAQNGDRQMVQLLLDAGADKRLQTDEGKTPAMLASDAGHAELAFLLGE